MPSKRLADLFESQQTPLKRAMEKTGLADQEWEFSDLAQYLYACVQRGARELWRNVGCFRFAKSTRMTRNGSFGRRRQTRVPQDNAAASVVP
jgi:hypothetical protein